MAGLTQQRSLVTDCLAMSRSSRDVGDMKPLVKGKYTARPAEGDADMQAVLALRLLCFGAAGGAADRFDTTAQQIVVCEEETNRIVAGFRMSVLTPTQLQDSYAAQFYDLTALQNIEGPLLELGRFCIHPEYTDPDILRLAWAALTAHVDRRGVKMLFGCSSFQGTDPAPYLDAFALLKARHLAPPQWRPLVKAAEVFPYAAQLQQSPDLARATATLPSLLRTYLMMGGWVSDHAVVDPVMDTLHVFTAVEIDAIPPARKRLLRALV